MKMRKQMAEEEKPGGAYDEGNDPQFQGAPHMADGGYVDDDPQMLGDLTKGTSSQVAPAPIAPPPPQTINQDGKQYAFSPGQQGALTVQNQGVPPPSLLTAPPPVAKSIRLPGMPEGVGPDEIAAYLARQKGQLNKYGPEAQMALQQQLTDRQNSLGNRATEGLNGFGDALMMGVARAGNPGWQQQFQAKEQQNAENQMGALRGAGEANIKRTEAGMSLDRMDPKSDLSKSAQNTYAPLFQKLGYQPAAIRGMSSANIENALSLMTQFGGEQIKAEIQRMQFGLENKKLDASLANINSDIENRKQERSLEQSKMQHEARQQFSNMPWYSHITNRTALKSAEQDAGLGAYTPDVMAYADKHGITPDQALRVKKARGG